MQADLIISELLGSFGDNEPVAALDIGSGGSWSLGVFGSVRALENIKGPYKYSGLEGSGFRI